MYIKKVYYLIIMGIFIVGLLGQVIFADDIPEDVLVQISLRVSQLDDLDISEKADLQDKLLERLREGELLAEDLLNELDKIIELQLKLQSGDTIQNIILAGINGVDQEAIKELMNGSHEKELEDVTKEINEALENGVDAEKINEILKARYTEQNMELIENALKNAANNQEKNENKEKNKNGKEDENKDDEDEDEDEDEDKEIDIDDDDEDEDEEQRAGQNESENKQGRD